jgi:hypothetical protein
VLFKYDAFVASAGYVYDYKLLYDMLKENDYYAGVFNDPIAKLIGKTYSDTEVMLENFFLYDLGMLFGLILMIKLWKCFLV